MFKPRQRHAVQYFRRYILQDRDIVNDEVADEQKQIPIEKIWEDLDPESDEWDRRLLYEVTGRRLNEAEYRGDDTSDEEEEGR